MFSPLLVALAVAQPVAAEATATGAFDVAAPPGAAASSADVLTFRKTYHGALDGGGALRMVGSGDPASGTASYAGVEQVTATLAGRRGGFVLLHTGWMHAGAQELNVRIAPGSGTGELRGIGGTMDIVIEGGVHRYVLHYRFAHRAEED